MKTKTINLYEFSELSETVKQKAIENLSDINTDQNWYEFTLENECEKLKEKGFNDPKINFSGFSSQGDGACFDISGIDFLKVFDSFEITVRSIVRKLIENNEIEVTGKILKNSYGHHYSHEKTRYFEIDINYCAAKTSLLNIYDYLTTFEPIIENIRLNLSKDIYKVLNDEYDYLTSKEAIIETIEANEYTFTIDGKLENL